MDTYWKQNSSPGLSLSNISIEVLKIEEGRLRRYLNLPDHQQAT
jgi:hypothetical protein